MFVIRAKIEVDGEEYLIEKDENEPYTRVFRGDEDKTLLKKVAEVRSLIESDDIRTLIEMVHDQDDSDQ